jgi:transcriptional regulator of nitric oxide reductase
MALTSASFAWVCSVCIPLIALVFAPPAVAERGKLRERLTTEVTVVFPGAERFGMEEGSPPVSFVPTYQQIEL